jgi:hypothetical protein
MPIESPQGLLIYKLQAIKDAEMQATEALKRLMPEIENPELQELIERRQDQGREILTAVGAGLEELGGGAEEQSKRGCTRSDRRVGTAARRGTSARNEAGGDDRWATKAGTLLYCCLGNGESPRRGA